MSAMTFPPAANHRDDWLERGRDTVYHEIESLSKKPPPSDFSAINEFLAPIIKELENPKLIVDNKLNPIAKKIMARVVMQMIDLSRSLDDPPDSFISILKQFCRPFGDLSNTGLSSLSSLLNDSLKNIAKENEANRTLISGALSRISEELKSKEAAETAASPEWILLEALLKHKEPPSAKAAIEASATTPPYAIAASPPPFTATAPVAKHTKLSGSKHRDKIPSHIKTMITTRLTEQIESYATIIKRSSMIDTTQKLKLHQAVQTIIRDNLGDMADYLMIMEIPLIETASDAPPKKASVDDIPYFIDFMIQVALSQTLQNPEQLVSHAFSHSCSVFRMGQELLTDHSALLGKICTDYGIKAHTARFIVGTICLFHDIGYPSQDADKLKKSAHAFLGAESIINLHDAFPRLLTEDLAPDRIEMLFLEIHNAILNHGSDKKEAVYSYAIEIIDESGTAHSKYLVEPDCIDKLEIYFRNLGIDEKHIRKIFIDPPIHGRKVEAPLRFEGKTGITEIERVSFGLEDIKGKESVFTSIIALLDNADESRDRKTELQKHPAFTGTYYFIGTKGGLPNKENTGKIYELAKFLSNSDQMFSDEPITDTVISELNSLIASLISNESTSRIEHEILEKFKSRIDSYFAAEGTPITKKDLFNLSKKCVFEAVSKISKRVPPEIAEAADRMMDLWPLIQVRHWASTDCIIKIDIRYNPSSGTLDIVPIINRELHTRLNATIITEGSERIPLGDYKISAENGRLKAAIEGRFIEGRPIIICEPEFLLKPNR